MIDILITSFVTFLTVIDPIGTIPVFIAVTANVDKKERKKIAFKAAFTATLVLLFFISIGEIILDAIDVPLPTFQIAGGIVLLLFALSMIFGDSKAKSELSSIEKNEDKAIFPLAIPSLAGPGAILAAILLTENSKHNFLDQALTALMMIAVMFIAWVLMMLSNRIFAYIGNSGAAIISRVMGLILSAVAVSNMLQGLKVYFNL